MQCFYLGQSIDECHRMHVCLYVYTNVRMHVLMHVSGHVHLRDSLIPKYAELVYYGFWFAPEREALQALVSDSQKHVTGRVRIKLYKGNIITAGRQSPLSLYNPEIATMEADPTQAYNQDDATGFIRLNGLRLKVAAQVHLAQKPAKKQGSVRKSKGTRKGKTQRKG